MIPYCLSLWKNTPFQLCYCFMFYSGSALSSCLHLPPLLPSLLCSYFFPSLFSLPSSFQHIICLLPSLSPPLSSSSSVTFMVETLAALDSFPIVLWHIADQGVLLRKGLRTQLSAWCQEGDLMEDRGLLNHLLTTVRCGEGERKWERGWPTVMPSNRGRILILYLGHLLWAALKMTEVFQPWPKRPRHLSPWPRRRSSIRDMRWK